MKFSIIVTMQLKKGMGDAFRPHILKNAEATRRDEPDNHGFTVLVDQEDPDRYHFFETYTDRAAWEAHRESPHFKAYAEATKDMVEERIPRICDRLDG